ncbi:hypothetical protein IA69_25445 [Massilia sp. JS1662]|nr:hypothetical protein IA69_25445 [Massilia sp. JS1662]
MMTGACLVSRAGGRSRRKARRVRTARCDEEWVDSTPAFAFGSNDSGTPDSSSDFCGDGGTFDGGGASGDWDD